MKYDIENGSIEFTIGDFADRIQKELISTLDINGFIANEKKFRQIVADAILLEFPPESLKKVEEIIHSGNLLPLERDIGPTQVGPDFRFNSYKISIDVLPGQPEKVAELEEMDESTILNRIYNEGRDPEEGIPYIQKLLDKEWYAAAYAFLQPDIDNEHSKFWRTKFDVVDIKKKKEEAEAARMGEYFQRKHKRMNKTAADLKEMILSVIGVDILGNWILAYMDENHDFRYAGKVKPFLGREELYLGTSWKGPKGVTWIDPRKQKKVKVKNSGLQICLTDTYLFCDATVTRIGKKLSAVGRKMEVIELVTREAALTQLYSQQKKVCPYCKKVITEGEEPVSHVTCKECEKKLKKDVEEFERLMKGIKKEASDFKFDPNSTENEGRWRIDDPKKFGNYKRWDTWAGVKAPEGVQFLVGDLKESREKGLQAIRFDKSLWDEAKTGRWWDTIKNKSGFEKKWVWKKEADLATSEKDVQYFKERLEGGYVTELLVSGNFKLVFDGNDEFWILNVGNPIWRSKDTIYSDTVKEWNAHVLLKDHLTEEELESLDRKKTSSPTSKIDIVSKIVKKKDGWYVLSEKGRNLGGPYKSRNKAKERLRQVEYFKHKTANKRFSYEEVLTKGQELIKKLHLVLKKPTLAGSIARKAPTAKDIDIVALADSEQVIETLQALNIEPQMSGEAIIRFTYKGIPVDLNIVEDPKEWGATLLYCVGPDKLNIAMRAKAKKLGLKLNEHGLFDEAGNRLATEEKEIFEKLDMTYRTPEERQRDFGKTVSLPNKPLSQKDAGFLPSFMGQPLWEQHPAGEDHADYKYPLEQLYPREFWDTWNAYTKIPSKIDPTILLNLFKKLKGKKPLSKKEVEKEVEETGIEKESQILKIKQLRNPDGSDREFDVRPIYHSFSPGQRTQQIPSAYGVYSEDGNILFYIPAKRIMHPEELKGKIIEHQNKKYKKVDLQNIDLLPPLDAVRYLTERRHFEEALKILETAPGDLKKDHPKGFAWLKQRSAEADITSMDDADLLMSEGSTRGKLKAVKWLAIEGDEAHDSEYLTKQVFNENHSKTVKKGLIDALNEKQYDTGLHRIFEKHEAISEDLRIYVYDRLRKRSPSIIWQATKDPVKEIRERGYGSIFKEKSIDHEQALTEIRRLIGLEKEEGSRLILYDGVLHPYKEKTEAEMPEGVKAIFNDALSDSEKIKAWISGYFTLEPSPKATPELPFEEGKVVEKPVRVEDLPPEEQARVKKELGEEEIFKEARQPPTTWPNNTDAWNLDPAVPTHVPHQDELLLKDVRQYIGRPEGKWRSNVNWVWQVIRDLLGKKDKNEEDKKKNKTAALGSKEEALNALEGTASEQREAIEYFGSTKDNEGLIKALQRVGDKGALRDIVYQAKTHEMDDVVREAYKSSDVTVREDATRALGDLGHTSDLKKIVIDEEEMTSIRSAAVEMLVELDPEFLSKIEGPSSMRRIVVHFQGKKGDIDSLVQALGDPSADVQAQAVGWLSYHDKYDVLKEMLEQPGIHEKVKSVIEDELTKKRPKELPPVAGFGRLPDKEKIERIQELEDEASLSIWDDPKSLPEKLKKVVDFFQVERKKSVSPEVARELDHSIAKGDYIYKHHKLLNIIRPEEKVEHQSKIEQYNRIKFKLDKALQEAHLKYTNPLREAITNKKTELRKLLKNITIPGLTVGETVEEEPVKVERPATYPIAPADIYKLPTDIQKKVRKLQREIQKLTEVVKINGGFLSIDEWAKEWKNPISLPSEWHAEREKQWRKWWSKGKELLVPKKYRGEEKEIDEEYSSEERSDDDYFMEKQSATYDTWETDNLWNQIFEDRGEGVRVFPHRDYPEDSRTFPREQTRPRHQQEHWWRKLRDKMEAWKKKKDADDDVVQEEEVGGEGMSPGPVPGFWHQSPTTFNAMPHQSSQGNTVSFTFEFGKEELRIQCTWDKDDIPSGIGEEQTLARIVDVLTENMPEAIAQFKRIRAEDVDLQNRTITLRMGK